MPAKSRVASLFVEKSAGKTARSTVTVAVPKGVTARDFTHILERVRGLTACPACISGGIDLIFREEFANIINVDLETGKVIQ